MRKEDCDEIKVMAEVIPPVEQLLQQALEAFKQHFHEDATVRVCAPGRVNLIGEHTDYNDGFVLPMAIPLVTVIVGKKSKGPSCEVITLNHEFSNEPTVTFPPKLNPGRVEVEVPRWSRYILGVTSQFKTLCSPFKAAVIGSVPVGGGLSSSASLEVAMYTFLEALHPEVKVSARDKALACQEAEHVYAGVPCGLMDQFISVMGKSSHALCIDCRDMSTELVPMRNPTVRVLITDSNFRHALVDGEYAKRREQCEKAAEQLGVTSLRDCSIEQLQAKKSQLDTLLYRRAHHVITENDRVQRAVKALKTSDYVVTGQLMRESHLSLKDDYEVSCAELDTLVEIANSTEGVFGSRMTGGGFGGCTVSLVKNSAVEKLMEAIKAGYHGNPKFYLCNACDGCTILSA